jgi:hypothetical protein
MKIAAVELHRTLQLFDGPGRGAFLLRLARLRQSLLELLHVECNRSCRQANLLGVDLKQAIGLREVMAEIVEHVAHVGPGLSLGRVRPQQKGEMLARLRCVPVEQEIDEERLRPRDPDTFNRLPSRRETESAE